MMYWKVLNFRHNSKLSSKRLKMLKENSRHCKLKQNSQSRHIIKQNPTFMRPTKAVTTGSALENKIFL